MSIPFFAIDDLVVQFGGLRAIDGFSMQVERGSIHALIGPNGAGKSTVFNCISRFVTPQSGQLHLGERSLLSEPAYRIPVMGIARTFQNIELCREMTVLDNVLVGMMPHVGRYFPFLPGPGRRRIERSAIHQAETLLERLGLSRHRDQRADELDFGHQKLLDLARALAARPTLLLLDEPAAGLRNREIALLDALLVDLARETGVTVILVEHVMQLVMAIADRITVLSFGHNIAEGDPLSVRSDPQVIEAYLGQDVDAAA